MVARIHMERLASGVAHCILVALQQQQQQQSQPQRCLCVIIKNRGR